MIPMNNPCPKFHGKAKGFMHMLQEHGFNVQGMHAKCIPMCPVENENCCMAQLLSKQDDFWLQQSLLEMKITEHGHYCIFLPKFHCELNPIEMVFYLFNFPIILVNYICSTRAGSSTGIGRFIKLDLRMQRNMHTNALMHAPLTLSAVFLTDHGDSWMLISRG